MAPRPPTRPTPALVHHDEDVPALDPAASQAGRLTQMEQAAKEAVELGAQAARAMRDVIDDHPTPPDGQPIADEVRLKGEVRVKKPRVRRPGWPATLGMCIVAALGGTPIWSLVTGASAELGELRGRQAALEQQVHSLAAADLKSAADRAVEFRELDAKIVAVGQNVEAILVQTGVPPERRTPIPPTSQETIARHNAAEAAWTAALRAAERRQVEQAMADSDTVAPP